jgi:hypothetical protein
MAKWKDRHTVLLQWSNGRTDHCSGTVLSFRLRLLITFGILKLFLSFI